MAHAVEVGDVLDPLRLQVGAYLSQIGRKQSALARDCGVDPADLTHFLRGERLLPAFALANLSAVVNMDVTEVLLATEYVRSRKKVNELTDENIALEAPAGAAARRLNGWSAVQAAYQSLLDAPRNHGIGSNFGPKVGTLSNWRDWISPVAVIVGDRREDPPRTPADLLAVSGSAGDLFNLLSLMLPPNTDIISDKTVYLASEDSLRRRFGEKNLLIIASPAANLAARAVNSGACFSFRCTADSLKKAEESIADLAEIKYLPAKVLEYSERNRRALRTMIFGFARSGILDPVDQAGMRGIFVPASLDFGTITICRHPWSDDRLAILAAGLHCPATAIATRLLANPTVFESHPLGGVFKVYVPTELPWDERFSQLSWEWDTHDYTLAKYQRDFEEFVASLEGERRDQYNFWDIRRIRDVLEITYRA